MCLEKDFSSILPMPVWIKTMLILSPVHTKLHVEELAAS